MKVHCYVDFMDEIKIKYQIDLKEKKLKKF